MKHVRMICAECGGSNVMCDAWAEWDERRQKWVLQNTFDHAHCDDCDGETSLKEVEIVTMTVTRETADAILGGLQEAHDSRVEEIEHGEHDEEDQKRNNDAADQYAKAIDELAAVMPAQPEPATA